MNQWLNAFVIAMMAWVAGVLYMSQLLVHHRNAPPGSIHSFKIKERRLGWIVTLAIAMAVSLILAVWLEWRDNSSGPKLAFVVFLAILTDLFQRWVRYFANDERRRTKKSY